MHTSETEQEEGMRSYHSNLLTPWHRHTVAGASAPEHSTIAAVHWKQIS